MNEQLPFLASILNPETIAIFRRKFERHLIRDIDELNTRLRTDAIAKDSIIVYTRYTKPFHDAPISIAVVNSDTGEAVRIESTSYTVPVSYVITEYRPTAYENHMGTWQQLSAFHPNNEEPAMSSQFHRSARLKIIDLEKMKVFVKSYSEF